MSTSDVAQGSSNPNSAFQRLALIRQTVADLEQNGHPCDWGMEADIKWLLSFLDFIPTDVFHRALVSHGVISSAPETECGGIKCTHCDGKGKLPAIYDGLGWSDEIVCETCGGSGRIRTVEQYLKTLPADWHQDSNLATWFPLTAEEHDRYKRCLYRANGRLIQRGEEPEKLDYPERPELKASVQLCAPHGKDWLTCPECAKAAGIGK